MRKSGSAYLVAAVVLLVLAVFIFLPSGAGPGALDREMGFWGGLHNSLYNLDLAKGKWMEDKHKAEGDIPTMQDLAPYLGEWTNQLVRLIALGVRYEIRPPSEAGTQTDIAMLTHDLRFRRGYCRFYRAGTSYGLLTSVVSPPYDTAARIQSHYFNHRELLAAGLFALAVASLLVFTIRRARSLKPVTSAHGIQNA